MFYIDDGNKLFVVAMDNSIFSFEGRVVLMEWDVNLRQLIRRCTYPTSVEGEIFSANSFHLNGNYLAVSGTKYRKTSDFRDYWDWKINIFSLAVDEDAPIASIDIVDTKRFNVQVVAGDMGFVIVTEGVLRLWNAVTNEEEVLGRFDRFGSSRLVCRGAALTRVEGHQQLVLLHRAATAGRLRFSEPEVKRIVWRTVVTENAVIGRIIRLRQ
jgi:hypothetical protein